jgi:hypothetical protein
MIVGKNVQEALPNFAALWQNTRLKITDEFTALPVILLVGDSTVGTLGDFLSQQARQKVKRPSIFVLLSLRL